MRPPCPSTASPGDWKVDVKFTGRGGTLLANATGLLLVPPEHALAYVTDPAGDGLFRVVQRNPLPPAADDGSHRVEVVNKAAVRVLAWKIWTSNRVVYEIAPPVAACACGAAPGDSASTNDTSEKSQAGGAATCCCSGHSAHRVSFQLLSSNMLRSLSGMWSLQPVKISPSSLPASFLRSGSFSSRSGRDLVAACRQQPLGAISLQQLAVSPAAVSDARSTSNSTSGVLPPGLKVDADGNILATLVRYEQYAQPKGMPPGVRFVPGMSDAVRSSIGREVRQMLDKIHHTSQLAVSAGLSPPAALAEVCEQLEQAGGSFKKLRKKLLAASTQQSEATAAAGSSDSQQAASKPGGGGGVGSLGSRSNVAAAAAPGAKSMGSKQQQHVQQRVGSHLLLLTVWELGAPADDDVAAALLAATTKA